MEKEIKIEKGKLFKIEVSTQDGIPIPNASITIFDGKLSSCVTDENGEAYLGSDFGYVMFVEREGFDPVYIPLENTDVKIVMNRSKKIKVIDLIKVCYELIKRRQHA